MKRPNKKEENMYGYNKCKCGNDKFWIYSENYLADQTAHIYICTKCGEEI